MAESSLGHSVPASSGDDGDRPQRGLFGWLRLLLRPKNGDSMRESLEELIEEREEVSEPIDPQERTLIGNILKLHDLAAADVMVQRVDIVGMDAETPFADVVKLFAEQGHSRLPVYRGTLD